MNNSFWSDFLANFLSDLLVGGLLAGALAWWIGRSERSQQRKDEKRAEFGKAIRYLELLKSEVDSLVNQLPNLVDGAETILAGVGMNERELCIPTPVWDILEPSGELPRLFDPQLLASLAQFYHYLTFAKAGVDRYFSKANPQISDTQSYQVTIQHGFGEANKIAGELPAKIDLELQSLNSDFAALK